MSVSLCMLFLIRSFVRNCIFSGNQPYGIHNGIDGLINDEVRPIEWSDVTGWVVEVGLFFSMLIIYPYYKN